MNGYLAAVILSNSSGRSAKRTRRQSQSCQFRNAREIARLFDVELTALLQGSRRKELIDARGALCFIATRKMGISGVVVAKSLNISRSGVLVAARRGEKISAKFPELQKLAGLNQPNHLRPL